MPKYLDHHKAVQLPPQVAQQLVADIKAGKAAPDGVKPINAFMSKGEMWCLAEAPNADTVHKHHEALGIKVGKGDIVEVQTLV
ncbi:MAG: DUF4242 domain-containing protein [Chloroflexi bacterium]|nr:DUF4242 domain-containing protein [Chloroflexota bacterium]